MTENKINGKMEYKEIGKIVYLKDKVFYCSNCDKRFDYAIIYKEYANNPSCKICNKDMEIVESSLRLIIPHPKLGGW